jgi:hypothetical protein
MVLVFSVNMDGTWRTCAPNVKKHQWKNVSEGFELNWMDIGENFHSHRLIFSYNRMVLLEGIFIILQPIKDHNTSGGQCAICVGPQSMA